MGYSTFNKQVEEITTHAYHAAELMLYKTLAQVEQEVPGEATNKIYAAILLAASPLKFMATLMAKGVDAQTKHENSGKETMLVAALIVARTAFPSKASDGSEALEVNFTPRNVLAAIEAANKIAGRDLNEYLDHRMIDEYKDGTEKSGMTSLGYWDYLDDNGPEFADLSEELSAFAKANKTRH